MKLAWIVLIISALTDFVINTGTSLMAAMVATGKAQMPAKAVVVLAIIGGAVQLARTFQQALKADTSPAGLLFPTPKPPAPVQQ